MCHLQCVEGICSDHRGGDGPYYQWDCTDYAAYAARKALLEALKARGIKMDASRICEGFECDPKLECSDCPFREDGPGTLIFIPEAQE
jgi:hypothetical protein